MSKAELASIDSKADKKLATAKSKKKVSKAKKKASKKRS
jgi:hypothetical protein